MATLNNWHKNSGVIECPHCEGRGSHWNGRGLGGNDPDSWDVECDACEGYGNHECKVCGFGIAMPGFDCLVCETVVNIPAALLTAEVQAELLAAIPKAIAKAQRHANAAPCAADRSTIIASAITGMVAA